MQRRRFEVRKKSSAISQLRRLLLWMDFLCLVCQGESFLRALFMFNDPFKKVMYVNTTFQTSKQENVVVGVE